MDYCKENGLSPAQFWDIAEKAWNEYRKHLVNPDQCGSGRLIGRNYPEDYYG